MISLIWVTRGISTISVISIVGREDNVAVAPKTDVYNGDCGQNHPPTQRQMHIEHCMNDLVDFRVVNAALVGLCSRLGPVVMAITIMMTFCVGSE